MRNIPPVADFELSKSYEFLNETFGDTVRSRGPALNVNTLGEVPDSRWFTNRLGLHDMTVDQVVRGPNQVDGPAPGVWHVTGRPDSGITPKFTIRDAGGVVERRPTSLVGGAGLRDTTRSVAGQLTCAVRGSPFPIAPGARPTPTDAGTRSHRSALCIRTIRPGRVPWS
jgi:hypothetical protein